MVFRWFWGLTTIGNDGFQWLSTIALVQRWNGYLPSSKSTLINVMWRTKPSKWILKESVCWKGICELWIYLAGSHYNFTATSGNFGATSLPVYHGKLSLLWHSPLHRQQQQLFHHKIFKNFKLKLFNWAIWGWALCNVFVKWSCVCQSLIQFVDLKFGNH